MGQMKARTSGNCYWSNSDCGVGWILGVPVAMYQVAMEIDKTMFGQKTERLDAEALGLAHTRGVMANSSIYITTKAEIEAK